MRLPFCPANRSRFYQQNRPKGVMQIRLPDQEQLSLHGITMALR